MSDFPKRLHYTRRTAKVIDIPVKVDYGTSARLTMRNLAKRSSLYFQKIDCDIAGQDDVGNKIPINNVGKWLFGTPGYMGHLKAWERDGNLHIEYPPKSPQIVHDLINKIIEELLREEDNLN